MAEVTTGWLAGEVKVAVGNNRDTAAQGERVRV
jgi:hypothetical protein